jgi:hypothetical protein
MNESEPTETYYNPYNALQYDQPPSPTEGKRPWYRGKGVLLPVAVVAVPTIIVGTLFVSGSTVGGMGAPALAPLFTLSTSPLSGTPNDQDSIFISMMRQDQMPDPDAVLLNIGHEICQRLAAGQDVATQMATLHRTLPELASGETETVVFSSEIELCPDQHPKIDDYMNSLPH